MYTASTTTSRSIQILHIVVHYAPYANLRPLDPQVALGKDSTSVIEVKIALEKWLLIIGAVLEISLHYAIHTIASSTIMVNTKQKQRLTKERKIYHSVSFSVASRQQ